MDRLYRRYTLVAWFFTAYIAWEIVAEIIRSALGDSRFSRVYPHNHLSSHALYGLSILGLFDYVFWLVWMILLALLA